MRLHERNIINIIKQSHSVLQAQLKTQPFDEKIAFDGIRTHASGLHDQRANQLRHEGPGNRSTLDWDTTLRLQLSQTQTTT